MLRPSATIAAVVLGMGCAVAVAQAPTPKIISWQATVQKAQYVAVMGAVGKPGAYTFDGEAPTLEALVQSAGGLAPHALPGVTLVRRERPDLHVFYSPDGHTPLMPGDVAIFDYETPPPPATGVQLTLLGVLDRPIVVRVRPEKATLSEVCRMLNHGESLAEHVRLYPAPRLTGDGRLTTNSVLIFPTQELVASQFPKFPPILALDGQSASPQSLPPTVSSPTIQIAAVTNVPEPAAAEPASGVIEQMALRQPSRPTTAMVNRANEMAAEIGIGPRDDSQSGPILPGVIAPSDPRMTESGRIPAMPLTMQDHEAAGTSARPSSGDPRRSVFRTATLPQQSSADPGLRPLDHGTSSGPVPLPQETAGFPPGPNMIHPEQAGPAAAEGDAASSMDLDVPEVEPVASTALPVGAFAGILAAVASLIGIAYGTRKFLEARAEMNAPLADFPSFDNEDEPASFREPVERSSRIPAPAPSGKSSDSSSDTSFSKILKPAMESPLPAANPVPAESVRQPSIIPATEPAASVPTLAIAATSHTASPPPSDAEPSPTISRPSGPFDHLEEVARRIVPPIRYAPPPVPPVARSVAAFAPATEIVAPETAASLTPTVRPEPVPVSPAPLKPSSPVDDRKVAPVIESPSPEPVTPVCEEAIAPVKKPTRPPRGELRPTLEDLLRNRLPIVEEHVVFDEHLEFQSLEAGRRIARIDPQEYASSDDVPAPHFLNVPDPIDDFAEARSFARGSRARTASRSAAAINPGDRIVPLLDSSYEEAEMDDDVPRRPAMKHRIDRAEDILDRPAPSATPAPFERALFQLRGERRS